MLHRINGLRNRQFEFHFLDQAQGAATGKNGYVRKYKVDGTADGSCLLGAVDDSIAVDDVTGLFVTDGNAYSGSMQNDVLGECDNSTAPFVQGLTSGAIMATAAEYDLSQKGCVIKRRTCHD